MSQEAHKEPVGQSLAGFIKDNGSLFAPIGVLLALVVYANTLTPRVSPYLTGALALLAVSVAFTLWLELTRKLWHFGRGMRDEGTFRTALIQPFVLFVVFLGLVVLLVFLMEARGQGWGVIGGVLGPLAVGWVDGKLPSQVRRSRNWHRLIRLTVYLCSLVVAVVLFGVFEALVRPLLI